MVYPQPTIGLAVNPVEPLLALYDGLEGFLIGAVNSPWMPLALFAVCVLDGFFPPVPSETVLVAATAIMWTTNPQAIVLIVFVASAGAWIGDNCAYAIGRAAGASWRLRRSSAFARISGELRRRPEAIILTGRFVPVGRVVVNAAAGAVHLPWRRFLLLSLASSVAWAAVSTALAVLVGAFVPLPPLAVSLIAISVALLAGITVDRIVTWRRRTTARKEFA